MRQSSRWLAVAPLVQSSGATLVGGCVAIERSSRFDSGPDSPPPLFSSVISRKMTRPATPSPPPPTAIPPPGSDIPPAPRRSSTCDGSSRAPLRKRTGRILPHWCGVLNVESGADGARTRDLLAASQTLSQLSYG